MYRFCFSLWVKGENGFGPPRYLKIVLEARTQLDAMALWCARPDVQDLSMEDTNELFITWVRVS